MANGDYATELLIRWTPHTPVRYGKRRLRDSRTDSNKHSLTHTPAHQCGKQRPPARLSRSVAALAHTVPRRLGRRAAKAKTQRGSKKQMAVDTVDSCDWRKRKITKTLRHVGIEIEK